MQSQRQGERELLLASGALQCGEKVKMTKHMTSEGAPNLGGCVRPQTAAVNSSIQPLTRDEVEVCAILLGGIATFGAVGTAFLNILAAM